MISQNLCKTCPQTNRKIQLRMVVVYYLQDNCLRLRATSSQHSLSFRRTARIYWVPSPSTCLVRFLGDVKLRLADCASALGGYFQELLVGWNWLADWLSDLNILHSKWIQLGLYKSNRISSTRFISIFSSFNVPQKCNTLTVIANIV